MSSPLLLIAGGPPPRRVTVDLAATSLWGKRMEHLCLALPVQPGKTEAVRAFVKTIVESRWNEYEKLQKRSRVQKVTWCLQSSPRSHQLLIYNEGEDLTALIREFAVSTHSFDVWFRHQALEITRVDFTRFEPSMLPELLLQYGY
jgi:hypothetical protein